MARQARIVIPDLSYHITQRGNYRQDVFDRDCDYKQYCRWINEYAKENNVAILAYCLMVNHVHFVVIPKQAEDLACLFKTVHMRYAHYINRQRQVNGHLWQGRFYSCILDDAHLYRAIRYVENNPVRAKIVKDAWDYEYSSASDHSQCRSNSLLDLTIPKNIRIGQDWKEYLKEDDSELTSDIRLKTKRGLAVGSDKFIKKLEGILNRSLVCIKHGRPRKDG